MKLITDDGQHWPAIVLTTDTGATIRLTPEEVYEALRRPVPAERGQTIAVMHYFDRNGREVRRRPEWEQE